MSLSMALLAQSPDYMNQKQFEIKSGKVIYNIEGKTKGTKTFWFDDYGRKQYTHTVTTTKMMGMTSKSETVQIRDSEYVYDLNLLEKTGTRMKLQDANDMIEATRSATSDAELLKMGKQMEKDLEGREEGTEQFLGRNCKVYVVGKLNGRSLFYKGVTLKTTIDMGGMLGTSNEVATSFDENISVPASQFTVPSGFEITDVSFGGMPMMNMDEDEE